MTDQQIFELILGWSCPQTHHDIISELSVKQVISQQKLCNKKLDELPKIPYTSYHTNLYDALTMLDVHMHVLGKKFEITLNDLVEL